MNSKLKIQYPSSEFPPPPAISLEIPDNWKMMTVSGALLGAIKIHDEQCFSANVIATWSREDIDSSIDEIAAGIEAELSSKQDSKLLGSGDEDLGGNPMRGRAAVFIDEVAGTIAQFHMVVLIKRETYSDLVHLTGTVGGDRLENDYPELRNIMTSLGTE